MPSSIAYYQNETKLVCHKKTHVLILLFLLLLFRFRGRYIFYMNA